MSRLLLWITTASLGVTAVFMTSFLGPAAFPLLTVAVIVIVRVDRLIAVSGLMIGFGGSWLVLLARQFTSGATFEGTVWVAGIVPLAVGTLALIVSLSRELSVTVFVSSHILSEVEQMCNRLAIIDRGRLITQGTMDELRSTEPTVTFGVDRIAEARRLVEEKLGLDVLSTDKTELRLTLPHERIADVNAALVKAGKDYTYVVMPVQLQEA